MSEVTWLCLLACALAFMAIALGFVSIGVFALVLSPLLAWYDWRAFGDPPREPHWWNRFGPSPPDMVADRRFRAPCDPAHTSRLARKPFLYPTRTEGLRQASCRCRYRALVGRNVRAWP